MGQKIRDKDSSKKSKAESVKTAEQQEARKADRGFYLAFMLLGGVIALIGGLSGRMLGVPIRDVVVPGPPPKILSLTNEEIVTILGEPTQSVGCDKILTGATGGKCRIYVTEDEKTFLVVVSELAGGE